MNKRIILKLLIFFGLFFVCADVFAQSDCTTLQAGGLFDDVVNNFHSGTNTWLTNAEKYASHIFWSLAGLEFAWSAITWALRKNTMGEYFASLFFKLMSIGFFFWIISMAPTWIPLVLQGFQTLATGITQGTGSGSIPTVAGMSGMISPSAVMNSGICIIQTIDSTSPSWSVSQLADAVLFGLAAVFSIVIIAISYCIITLQLVLTEVEAFIVLFGGLVMLGFTGSRWTSSWGERYFGYAVSVGVKLMVIYLVISLGNSVILSNIINIITQANQSRGVLDLNGFSQIIMVVLIYAGMAWMLPSMAGSFLNGSPNMSMGTMAAPAMAATAATVGAVAMAGSAAGGVMDAAGKFGSSMGSGGRGGSYDMAALEKVGQKFYEANKSNKPFNPNVASGSSSESDANSSAGNSKTATSGENNSAQKLGLRKDIKIRFDDQRNQDAGIQNTLGDPNAGGSNNTSLTDNNKGNLGQGRQFGLNRLSNAAQHLKSSDGSTGSVSVNIKHTD